MKVKLCLNYIFYYLVNDYFNSKESLYKAIDSYFCIKNFVSFPTSGSLFALKKKKRKDVYIDSHYYSQHKI